MAKRRSRTGARTRLAWLLTAALAASSSAALHCGSSDPPAPAQTSGASGAYSGAMVGEGFAAAVRLSIASSGAAPASLHPLAGTSVTLTGTIDAAAFGTTVTITGTYDPATQAVTFRGASPKGEISFSGRYENGVVTGPPATTPFGPAPLTLVKDLLGVKVFCGEITGGHTGLVGVFTAGDRAGAAYALRPSTQGSMLGSLAGAAVDIQDGAAKLLGNVSGATLTGTITASGAVGSFAAAEGACSRLGAALADGGTDSGGTDGGGNPDAGPPGTPEVVTTAAAPGPGHIVLSGGTLYYTIAHPYFQQKVEVHAIGTNGQGAREVLPVNMAPEVRRGANGLAVTNNTVFLVLGANDNGNPATLASVPAAGGALTDLGNGFGFGVQDLYYSSFVADGAGIYRVDCGGTVQGDPTRRGLFGGNTSGAPGGHYQPPVVGACAVASDGANVFVGFVTDGVGAMRGIYRVSNAIATTPPAQPTLVAEQDAVPLGAFAPIQALTTDATHVYWSATLNPGKGAVWRRPKDGSGATQLITVFDTYTRGAIAVDDTFVYYFTVTGAGQGAGQGTLTRVAKTATNGAGQAIGTANPYSVVSDGTYTYYGDGASLKKVRK